MVPEEAEDALQPQPLPKRLPSKLKVAKEEQAIEEEKGAPADGAGDGQAEADQAPREELGGSGSGSGSDGAMAGNPQSKNNSEKNSDT